jgi:hypothetical protein
MRHSRRHNNHIPRFNVNLDAICAFLSVGGLLATENEA